jgi:hypothetical protein
MTSTFKGTRLRTGDRSETSQSAIPVWARVGDRWGTSQSAAFRCGHVRKQERRAAATLPTAPSGPWRVGTGTVSVAEEI